MKTNVLISIDDEHLSEMHSIVAQLREVGVDVQRSLQTLGTVTGSVDQTEIPRVQEIEGVAGVEADREVGIPPPESPVQ